MPRISDAITHLQEAKQHLLLEAYRGSSLYDMEPVDHFTIAEELERIDRALGPAGKSMFAGLADNVRSAYVEIVAALEALQENPNDGE